MTDDADRTRRSILYAGGAALLTNALVSPAQSQGAAPAKAAATAEEGGEAKDEPLSPATPRSPTMYPRRSTASCRPR